MINFDSDICTDYAEASKREWLETNGIGGFAASTVSGAHTRRYHGLLTAATRPPLGRVTMLSKFEEVVTVNGTNYALSANQFPDTIAPNGYQYLKNFRLDPFPVWTFEIDGIEIEKKIFMVDGANTTVIRYAVQPSEKNFQLELKPLLSFCDYHHLQHQTDAFDAHFETEDNLLTVRPYAKMPPLYFAHNAFETERTGVWYRNFEYAVEKERGFDYTEDLFQPFALRFDLRESADVIVSTDRQNVFDATRCEQSEITRREQLLVKANAADDFTRTLILAADQFVVSRGQGKTIIAGYPWFSDWGRDTMIALNGLTLATNRAEIAKSILLEFSFHISEGMLPNRFPDAGDEPEYNNVDATLWYYEAIRAYAAHTGDYKFVRQNLYEKLVDIIVWHLKGTRFQIKMDADALLYAGEADVQLTWMDAKIGDLVVTPRTGKAVEIQALWYNALCVMADFAGTFGDWRDERQYLELAARAKESFNQMFWNEAENCLFDVVDGDTEKDASVRPNQIFAVSLPHAILTDADKARRVVETVESQLLTSFGLRSLSSKDAKYRPIYIGSPYERDTAYHQGTVWAWLIGGFVDAHRKVFPEREARVKDILDGFKNHLTEAGCGQISEIFDAAAPHNPRGCPAQAWSIAEVLRTLKAER